MPSASRTARHPSRPSRNHLGAMVLLVAACLGAACAAPPSAAPDTRPIGSPTPTAAPHQPVGCPTSFSGDAPSRTTAATAPDTLEPAETFVESLQAVEASHDGTVTVVTMQDDAPAFTTTPADMASIAEAVAGRDVLGVEAPQEVRPAAIDPLTGGQWGLSDVGYAAVWHCTRGVGTTVAVLDTGVNVGHPDLAGQVVAGPGYVDGNGWATPGAGGVDTQGHGTHVAGTIVALADNGIGVAGGAPAAKVYSVKVFNADGVGSSTDLARAIRHSVDVDVDVINLSLSSPSESVAVSAAIDYATAHNTVVVAAAGNTSGNCTVCWPAAHRDTIAVAAHTNTRATASWSVRGDYVDVSAPGAGIGSTIPGGYGLSSGTSMATPHVAALAALIRSADPNATAEEVRRAIVAGTVDLGVPGKDPASGHGAVDAVRTWNSYAVAD